MKLFSLLIVFVGYYFTLIFQDKFVGVILHNFNIKDSDELVIYLIQNLGFLIGIFFLSICYNNISFVDCYWSLYPVYSINKCYLEKFQQNQDYNINLRELFPIILINFWGIRLASQWCRDWKGFPHVDWRYVNFEKSSSFRIVWWVKSFLTFFMIPGIIVSYGSFLFLNYIKNFPVQEQSLENGPRLVELIGFMVIFISQVIQFSADSDLHNFKLREEKKDQSREEEQKVIDEGLWRYSRHPNYFGEVCFWWGLYIYQFDSNFNLPIGAFLVTLMIVLGSSPMMEEHILQGSRAQSYLNYKQRVISGFLPFIRIGN